MNSIPVLDENARRADWPRSARSANASSSEGSLSRVDVLEKELGEMCATDPVPAAPWEFAAAQMLKPIELRARLVDGRDPVARYFGRSFDAEQLIGGVPLPAGRVTTDELPECAGRAGLAITPAKVPAEHIKASMLPALIVSEGGDALVVLHRDGERMNALCPVG